MAFFHSINSLRLKIVDDGFCFDFEQRSGRYNIRRKGKNIYSCSLDIYLYRILFIAFFGNIFANNFYPVCDPTEKFRHCSFIFRFQLPVGLFIFSYNNAPELNTRGLFKWFNCVDESIFICHVRKIIFHMLSVYDMRSWVTNNNCLFSKNVK